MMENKNADNSNNQIIGMTITAQAMPMFSKTIAAGLKRRLVSKEN